MDNLSLSLDPKRRDFIFLNLAVGLSTLYQTPLVAKVFKRLDLETNAYSGRLLKLLNELTLKSDAGKLTQSQFIAEIAARIDELQPEIEFKSWVEELQRKQDQSGLNGEGSFSRLYKSSSKRRQPYLGLFYIPEGRAHAPHGHHSMVSVQTVLKGKLHVREYDRVKLFEPGLLGINKVTDKIASVGDQFKMTDQRNNIHWFGSHGGPTILLNCNISLNAGKTFYPRSSQRKSRIYVDPTSTESRDDLTVAREITKKDEIDEHLNRFETQSLINFPV